MSTFFTDAEVRLVDSLPSYAQDDVDKLSRRLREQGNPPDRVAWILTQQRLRTKARSKFGSEADSMLFTETGLQQATRGSVARLHAARYTKAGCSHVLDMTSGIGADARAFAKSGLQVTAVDLDPETAAYAGFNLREFPRTKAVCNDSLQLDLSAFDGVFADPARRSARGRTFNPDDYSPALSDVLRVRESVPSLGAKVAPGIAYSDIPADAHAQWISVDGSVVEAGLWFGPPAESPGRSALVIRGDEMSTIIATSDPREESQMLLSSPLGRYVYEPDGAVIRSGAIAELSNQISALPVSDQIAYLTGDSLVETPFATAFEVLDLLPFKAVREYLRERNVGSAEILKRGVDIVPDQFRKTLKLKGSGEATLILTRTQGEHRAIVVKRVESPGSTLVADSA